MILLSTSFNMILLSTSLSKFCHLKMWAGKPKVCERFGKNLRVMLSDWGKKLEVLGRNWGIGSGVKNLLSE